MSVPPKSAHPSRDGSPPAPARSWDSSSAARLSTSFRSRASSSEQTDSGVTARVFGSLLTWLNDHESDVFFIGTCNDASKLPPEFARAERFDSVCFVDLPSRDQKDAIWGIYTRHYGLNA